MAHFNVPVRRAWRGRLFAALGVAAVALALGGCGEDAGEEEAVEGRTLTIYSSLPLQGAARVQNEAIVEGAELALEQADGRVGKFTVEYRSLDDSTAQAGAWTPEATSANARKAIQDDTTIAYIGEFNSGASAISIPLLNEAGIAQVSPGNTAVGLTSDDPGAEPGEPDKYYPTGERTYARLLPRDTIQGAALVTLMKEEGCEATYILNDREVYGAGLARNIEISAKKQELEVKGNDGFEKTAPNFRSQAARIKASGADCFVYSGITANNAVQIFKDVGAALPDARLFGPEGIGETAFFDPEAGGIPADLAERVKLTIPGLAPENYPPSGQRFLSDYRRKYGERNPDRYAIYGYESMNLVLDAIRRAGDKGNSRAAVVDQLFATKGRESVLGTYDIDENGDITLTPYGSYKIEDGQLAFERTIKPRL
jgi:branched-chain amino acid transport system substrate-binding protein